MIGAVGGLGIMEGFAIGAIAAVIGAFIELFVTSMTLKDNLDSKSEWRKALFEVASKDEVTLESINILRATLRYKPKLKSNSHLCLLLQPLNRIYVSQRVVFYLNILLMVVKLCSGCLVKNNYFGSIPKYFNIPISFIISGIIIYIILFGTYKFYLYNFQKLGEKLGYKVNIENSIFKFVLSCPKISDYKNGVLTNEIEVFNLLEKAKSDGVNLNSIPLFYFNFDSITKTIIDFCSSVEKIDEDTARMTKLFTLYMLKHHWEELSVPEYRFIKKIDTKAENNIIIKDLINEIVNGESVKSAFGIPKMSTMSSMAIKYRKKAFR